jgi:tetratricopeptide (TPR) repeat protein
MSTSAARNTSNVPLSQSALWRHQTEFYQSQNIRAWDSRVPYYATCNPYIANAYANTIIRYLQETMRGAAADGPPCYIVELGAGPGIFTYYLLRRIDELASELGMRHLPFVYVATDCVAENIEFWKNHSRFRDFIARGKLDFALCDLLRDKELHLQISGKTLAPRRDEATPMVLVANYLFDSLPQDIFRVVDGVAQEGMVPQEPLLPQNLPDNTEIPFTHIDSAISYVDLATPRYDDPALDATLTLALARSKNQYLLMPSGALRGLHNLLDIAGDRCMLISTDKAYGCDAHKFSRREPGLVFHSAAFSMMVDFDIIGQFFRRRGGDCFHQATTKEIGTAVFLASDSFDALLETRHAARNFLDRFSPGDLFGLYTHLRNVQSGASLNILVSYLNMTGWDPYVFESHFHHILAIIGESESYAVHDLVRGLPKMAENYYQLRADNPFHENIGILLQRLKLFDKAIASYQRVLEQQGPKETVHYNLGLCHCSLGGMDQAKAHFAKAIQLRPDYIQARGWLQLIEEKEKETA